MIGICLSDGHFMSFSSRRCIFLCLLISPSALNDHHPGEREEQSRLVTFLPTEAKVGRQHRVISSLFSHRGVREEKQYVFFCFVPHPGVYGIEWTIIVFCSQSSLFSLNTNQCDICVAP